jgi:CRISPR system Cascade subunit CasB
LNLHKEIAVTDREKQPFPQGKPDHPSFGLLLAWWRRLEDDKGERAFLRRAGTLTEVMLSPSFVDLLRTLRNQGYAVSNHNHPLSKIAAIAGLSARIKAPADAGLATRMGTPKATGSTPTFSQLRLRRILACDDIEELYTLLRRALAVLDDKADLADLAATVWNWSPLDDKRPFDPRRRLAYDYYAAAPIKS